MYTPDSWIILKIVVGSQEIYKVLAGWSGSYLYGSSWRLNSGIERTEVEGNYYYFYGSSGSIYKCHKDGEELRLSTLDIYAHLVKKFPQKIERVWAEDFVNKTK